MVGELKELAGMAFYQGGRPDCGDRSSRLKRIQGEYGGEYGGHLLSSIGVGTGSAIGLG